MGARAAAAGSAWRSGETLPLFGAPATLEVRAGRRPSRPPPEGLLVSGAGAARALETLVGWLKTQALEALAPRAAHFAEPGDCRHRESAFPTRAPSGGSAAKRGTIRLNWRLVHLEPRLADYVVAHEVAHLVEMNHSKRFWARRGLYPDWRGRATARTRRRRPSHHEGTTMRILHTMLRVGDLQRSMKFYTEVLGMRLLRTTERPEQKYSLAFVGYGGEERAAEIELTYNYGVERYELGTAYGHIALGVPDIGAPARASAPAAAR